jgi:hypothetical protein
MQIISNTTGNPPSSLFIYEYLFKFIDDVLFEFQLPLQYKDSGENKITQNIEISLNEKAHTNNTIFAFQNQHEEGKSTTDIGVYLRSNRYFFCWIEAKRLPTPKEKDRDEREYVIVSQEKENGKKKFKGSGGIQRFKESKHASTLPYSIMMGYIQEKDADYWLEKINGWVRQLTIKEPLLWNEKDFLSKQESKKCDKYLSVHERKNVKAAITLYHFWIKL